MSDLDDLRYDVQRDSSSAPTIANTSYYSNPVNPLDIATPGGQQLLDEVYPSARRRSGDAVQSPLLILCIAAFILFVMLI